MPMFAPARKSAQIISSSSLCDFQFPASERSLKGLLDDRQLALVHLEVEQLPGFGLFSRQVSIDFSLEFFLRKFLGLVQPGCTVEGLPVPPRHLGQFRRLAPAHFAADVVSGFESVFRGWPSGSRPSAETPGSAFPGTHQTIAGSRASSTVLPGPRKGIGLVPQTAHPAPVLFSFSQARISSILPRTNKARRRLISGCHGRPSVNPQARQANQGRSLPALRIRLTSINCWSFRQSPRCEQLTQPF